MEQAPPPEPVGEPQPNWRPWFAFAGFAGSLICTLVAVAIILAIAGVGEGEDSPAVTVVATLVQGVFFVGAALVLARAVAPPKPWHFGLRRAPLLKTIGWAVLGMLAFYVLTATYAAIVDPQAEQDVTDKLGAEDGTLGLVAAGLMVMVVAPFVEEIFFRGVLYRHLRDATRARGAAASILISAAISGIVFGAVHPQGLLAAPLLAAVAWPLVHAREWRDSLVAPMAAHAAHNAIITGLAWSLLAN
jgi:membrane protease YdiL (CAAX protease family)